MPRIWSSVKNLEAKGLVFRQADLQLGQLGPTKLDGCTGEYNFRL